jgi:hypothetical protein
VTAGRGAARGTSLPGNRWEYWANSAFARVPQKVGTGFASQSSFTQIA